MLQAKKLQKMLFKLVGLIRKEPVIVAPLMIWILSSHVASIFLPSFFKTPFQFNAAILVLLCIQFFATLLTIFLVSNTYMGHTIRLSEFMGILKRSKLTFLLTLILIECFPKGPSILISEPDRITLTFSGIAIFIFPIFDIKIPYKLSLHQFFAF